MHNRNIKESNTTAEADTEAYYSLPQLCFWGYRQSAQRKINGIYWLLH